MPRVTGRPKTERAGAADGHAAELAAHPKASELRRLQPFSGRWWETYREQGLRVYRDSGDAAGRILCRRHRDEEFAVNPAAHGEGELGGDCERCRQAAPSRTACQV